MKDTKTNQEIWEEAKTHLEKGIKLIAKSVDHEAEDFDGDDTQASVLCIVTMDDIPETFVAIGGGETALISNLIQAIRNNDAIRIGILSALMHEKVVKPKVAEEYHLDASMKSMLNDLKPEA